MILPFLSSESRPSCYQIHRQGQDRSPKASLRSTIDLPSLVDCSVVVPPRFAQNSATACSSHAVPGQIQLCPCKSMQQAFHQVKKTTGDGGKTKPVGHLLQEKAVASGSSMSRKRYESTNYQSLLARPLSFSAIGLVCSFSMLFEILGARQAIGTGLPPTGPVLD